MNPTLEHALKAFARTRSAALAPLVIDLGRAALEDFSAPKARTNLEFQKLWLDAVVDVRARSWCLQALTTQLPKLRGEHFSGEQRDGLVQRLNALLELAPDPRVARTLLDVLELKPSVIGFPDVRFAIAKALERHGDDETEATVKRLDERVMGAPNGPLVFPVRTVLSAEDRATFVRAKPAPNREAAALWRAVYEAPDDDAPREVLSDFLQERADPRGEFIALQLREARGLASNEDIARAQALVKAHGKTWLGALRPIASRAELRRGFLHRLELQGSWASNAWGLLAHDESLATVEALLPGRAVSRLVIPFIRSERLRNQRVVDVFAPEILEAVAEAKLPKLEGLTGFLWRADSQYKSAVELARERAFANEVFRYAEAQGHITSLGCDASLVPGLSTPVRERLTSFQCRQPLAQAMPLWRWLPNATQLTCAWPEELHLRRGDLKNLTVKPSPSVNLEGVPKSFQNVEIIGNLALAKRLQKAWGTASPSATDPRRRASSPTPRADATHSTVVLRTLWADRGDRHWLVLVAAGGALGQHRHCTRG